VAELRPLYLPPDPAGRTAYEAGVIGQCDFWFPDIRVPIGFGQFRMAKTLPVLTMVTGYSRWASAVLIPSRTAEDLYAGWWQHISALGACPRVLVWDGVGVRSGRSAVPVFRPVRFCGPPPEPDVPVPEHPALHVFMPCCGWARPWCRDACGPVVVAHDGDRCGAKHLDVLGADLPTGKEAPYQGVHVQPQVPFAQPAHDPPEGAVIEVAESAR